MLCCPHFRATVIELAQGHTACRSWSRDLNRYLGLKPACLTPTWSPWKPHQLLRVQLEHSSQHFIMFNSPTLRPFVSLCVCVSTMFILFLYTPSPTPCLGLHSTASHRLRMCVCKTQSPYSFHQITVDRSQNSRGKIWVSGLHSPTSQGHYEQNKWVVGMKCTMWGI